MTFLPTGASAPLFHAADIHGQPVQLSLYAGRPLLLSFFRNGACAICNLRVHQLIQRYPAYHKQGLEVLAVFESPQDSVLDYVGKQGPPFPIIADPQAQLYGLYGVETSEQKIAQSMKMPQTEQVIHAAAAIGYVLTPEPDSNFHRMPADFLIAPDQTIARTHYATHVSDHMPFSVIEAYLGLLEPQR